MAPPTKISTCKSTLENAPASVQPLESQKEILHSTSSKTPYIYFKPIDYIDNLHFAQLFMNVLSIQCHVYWAIINMNIHVSNF